MKFLVLILVLGLRRLDTSWPLWISNPQRHQGWLQQWSNRLGQGQRVWWLAVLLPAVLIAALTCWLDGFWGQLLVLALGIALMLWLVGGQSEFRHVDELLVRGVLLLMLLASVNQTLGHLMLGNAVGAFHIELLLV